MTNTRKTKSEMLQELESIKGLLLENDDIPLLQEVEISHSIPPVIAAQAAAEPTATQPTATPQPEPNAAPNYHSHTQTSLFDDEQEEAQPSHTSAQLSHESSATTKDSSPQSSARPVIKASGENPFLPQHIRERLHGNNPPPLFAHEAARKILNATKVSSPKNQRPRQQLIDDIVTSMMPQVESELRHRLFAMTTDELESLFKNQE